MFGVRPSTTRNQTLLSIDHSSVKSRFHDAHFLKPVKIDEVTAGILTLLLSVF